MNGLELQAERVRKGRSRRDIAEKLGLNYDAYLRKEKGYSRFSPQQIIIVSKELELTADKINMIFFDNQLPIGRKRKTG